MSLISYIIAHIAFYQPFLSVFWLQPYILLPQERELQLLTGEK